LKKGEIMKLSKKSIQKAKIELVDFSNCELSTKSYEESSMKKNAIIYNGEKYLLKYMEKNKARHYQDIKNQKETYFNSIYSEYISCHIGKMIGLDIQDTIIGFEKENNKLKGIQYIPCVACKDFCKSGENIVNFERIFEIVNRKENKRYNDENFNDVLKVIEKQKFIDKNKLKENFLDMFVFDSFIGNFDRNLKNFGIIENEKDKTYRITPIFDCASSLHPKANRKRIKFLANSYERNSQFVYEYALTPNSYFKDDNGIKINYFDFLVNNSFNYNSDIAKSIVKIVPKLIELNNNGTIFNMIDRLEGIIIRERIEVITKELNLKSNKMFISTLEIAKDVLNKEIKDKMISFSNNEKFKNYNKNKKEDFLFDIKNTIEKQELLIENKTNKIKNEELYEIIDDFFIKNSADIKDIVKHLKKNDFPKNYIEHFEEKIELEFNEIHKVINNKNNIEKNIKNKKDIEKEY
jgi:hypothetical protein